MLDEQNKVINQLKKLKTKLNEITIYQFDGTDSLMLKVNEFSKRVVEKSILDEVDYSDSIIQDFEKISLEIENFRKKHLVDIYIYQLNFIRNKIYQLDLFEIIKELDSIYDNVKNDKYLSDIQRYSINRNIMHFLLDIYVSEIDLGHSIDMSLLDRYGVSDDEFKDIMLDSLSDKDISPDKIIEFYKELKNNADIYQSEIWNFYMNIIRDNDYNYGNIFDLSRIKCDSHIFDEVLPSVVEHFLPEKLC